MYEEINVRLKKRVFSLFFFFFQFSLLATRQKTCEGHQLGFYYIVLVLKYLAIVRLALTFSLNLLNYFLHEF